MKRGLFLYIIFLLSTISLSFALTPSDTVIVSTTELKGKANNTTMTKNASSEGVKVAPVSGIQLTASPESRSINPGESECYRYTFKHTGNIGANGQKDKFYVRVMGDWVAGTYIDSNCSTPFPAEVSLPPNQNNEFTFYLKVIPPPDAYGMSKSSEVEIYNEFYRTNSKNDPFGDPDRVLHSLITYSIDNFSPLLAISSPQNGAKFTTSTITIVGLSEAGAELKINDEITPLEENGSFNKIITLPDGTHNISFSAKDSSNNYSYATLTVHIDSTLPTALIEYPPQYSTLSGKLVIRGKAWDKNFKSFKLEYGPTYNAILWNEIASSQVPIPTSELGASGVLGEWDTSSLAGEYTIKLTVEDTFGNIKSDSVLVRLRNVALLSGTVPRARGWQMISLPGEPLDPNPRTYFNSRELDLQRWDPNAEDDPYLVKYKVIFSISAGDGFWVRPYSSQIQYSLNTLVVDTTKKYAIRLYVGWNQIGVPYNRQIEWGDSIEVKNLSTGEIKTLSSAINSGWIGNSVYGYATTGYIKKSLNDYMVPYEGYFVRAFIDCELLFNPAAGLSRGIAKVVRPSYIWMIPISVVIPASEDVQTLSDNDNFIGIISASSNDFDSFDSPEPPTVSNNYVSLSFPHPEWGIYAGDYAEDFRAVSPIGTEVSWEFEVKTDKLQREAIIKWENLNLPDGWEFLLTDIDLGKTIDAKAVGEYRFLTSNKTISGKIYVVNKFKFSAKRLKATTITLNYTYPAGWNLISIPLEPEVVNPETVFNKKSVNLFQLWDGKLFTYPQVGPSLMSDAQLNLTMPNSVHLQSAVGYWLFSHKETNVNVTGFVNESIYPVQIPLNKGWNIIGNPYTVPIQWGDNIKIGECSAIQPGEGEQTKQDSKLISIKCKVQNTKSLSEAITAGIIHEDIFGWDGKEYLAIKSGGLLQPWNGYFIKAKEDCVLIFNTKGE